MDGALLRSLQYNIDGEEWAREVPRVRRRHGSRHDSWNRARFQGIARARGKSATYRLEQKAYVTYLYVTLDGLVESQRKDSVLGFVNPDHLQQAWRER